MKGWAFICIIFICNRAFAGKKVAIEWRVIDRAIEYELIIKRGNEVAKQLRLPVKKPWWEGELETGAYVFQVRGFDRFQRPGQWTKERELIVMPPRTQLNAPSEGARLVSMDNQASISLKWELLQGVDEYLVKVYSFEKPVKELRVKGMETHIELDSGDYSWTVTPILQLSRAKTSSRELASNSLMGPESMRASFSVETMALEDAWVAESALSISTMATPYRYELVQSDSTANTSAYGTAPTTRLSVQYSLHPAWRILGGFEESRYRILGHEIGRDCVELLGGRKFRLSDDPLGPHLYVFLGSELREQFTVSSSSVATAKTEFGELGPTFMLGLVKGFSSHISIEVKVRYHTPLLFVSKPGSSIDIGKSAQRNINAGLTNWFWFTRHWGFGVGGGYDHEGIDYKTGGTSESILKKGWYFFSSLVYRL